MKGLLQRLAPLALAYLIVTPLGGLTACGGAADDAGDDSSVTTYASIAVEPPTATLSVPIGETATQPYQAFGVAADGTRIEITTTCGFAIDSDYGNFEAAIATVGPKGGKAAITAQCGELVGQAQLIVNLTGSFTLGGAPANAGELFTGATLGTDAARTPAIEYPLDGAISPRNIPSIETQYTGGSGNDLFHVQLRSTYATVDAYSVTPEALLTPESWDRLAGTAAGERIMITVEGLTIATPDQKFASTPVSITITHDQIDQSAIYYWASSQGDIMSQTFGSPDVPKIVKNDCTSCHSVSRNGDRVGYSRCVGNSCGGDRTAVGFLKYDPDTDSWVETVNANDLRILGSYTTFNPEGTAAIVTHRGGTLHLHNPDTGDEIPTNLDIANAAGTRAALMPDWSADGNSVVFASTPHVGQYIDLTDGTVQTMTHAFDGTTHMFGTPVSIIPNPMVLPTGTYTNFFFPSYSPDGALVVANASRTTWRNGSDARAPGARLVLADSAGAWAADLANANGGADYNVTWAHWAPTISSEYYWIVFATERDYGHRTTEATSPASCKANGVRTCKQIWLSAIARNKLTGMVDPSAAPMWLPGQNELANNISPYWSRAAILSKAVTPR